LNLIQNSFKNKLILLIAFFQLVLVVILGGFFTNDIINREKERIYTENISLANKTMVELSNKIERFTKDIELLASIPSIESYNSESANGILKSTTVSSMFLSNETIFAYNNELKLFADNTMFGSKKDTVLTDSLLISKISPLSPYISGINTINNDYDFINIGVSIQNRSIGYGYLVAKFSMQRLYNIIKQQKKSTIVLFDRDGNFLSKSIKIMGNKTIDDYGISSNIYNKTVYSEININKKRYFYASSFNKKVGFGILILKPDSNIQQTINRFKLIAVGGLFGTFIISFLLSLILSSKLIRPLKNLTKKIIQVKEGNLDISTKTDKYDEIGTLANSFDSMRLNLKKSFSKLNLFISDLKFINRSSDKILVARSMDNLIKSYLENIAEVFSADLVFIKIYNAMENSQFDWSADGTDNTLNMDALTEETGLINSMTKSLIVTPIVLNGEDLGIIVIIKQKGDFYDKNRLETSEILANQIAVGLESLRLYKEEKDKLLIEHDLKNAKVVQDAIYPDKKFNDEKISIDYYYESADDLSGDWLQFYDIGNNEMLFAVGDVTGHGVGASLLTSTVHTFFQIFSKKLIPSLGDDISKTLEELNNIVSSSKNHLNMTLLLAKISFDKKQIEVCNAGHNNAIIFRKEDDKIKIITLANLNTRIGEEGSTFLSSIYEISENDKVLFYTDGIIEWNDERGREWGKKNLVKYIQKNYDKDDDVIIQEIISILDKKMVNRDKMDDDLTLSLVTIKKLRI